MELCECVCVCVGGDNSLFECFHLELKQAQEIPHELVEPASWASRGHTDLFRTLTQLSHFYHVTSLLNSGKVSRRRWQNSELSSR